MSHRAFSIEFFLKNETLHISSVRHPHGAIFQFTVPASGGGNMVRRNRTARYLPQVPVLHYSSTFVGVRDGVLEFGDTHEDAPMGLVSA